MKTSKKGGSSKTSTLKGATQTPPNAATSLGAAARSAKVHTAGKNGGASKYGGKP